MTSILRKAICLGCLLALSSIFTWVMPVQAQGGFAMSGSFYAQKLELPQGTSIRTPDIYIVIFNNSSEDLNVKMTTKVPMGVKIVLPEYDFPLKANSQKKLEVGIDVGKEAIPGEYKIGIIAEPYKQGAGGIKIVGAAGQEAQLTITGESGTVDVATVSPDGAPVPAMITLFRKYDKNDFEIARTDSGNLKLTVSPGNYMARAYIAGNKLAEESFAIAANERKTISLVVKTVYFEGFEIVPNYQKDTGKLAIVQVVYAVNNLLQSFPSAKVNLLVRSNEAQLEKITLVNLSHLEKGKMELSYNYMPVNGWQQKVYFFKLELEVEGKVYTVSLEKELKVDETGGAKSLEAAPTSGRSINWLIIAGVAVGILIVVTIIVLARRRMK